jgi:intracellular septation protein A
MVDDPWFDLQDDVLFKFMYFSVLQFMNATSIALIALPVLTYLLRHRYSIMWRFSLILVFVIGLILLAFDPGQRLRWYSD